MLPIEDELHYIDRVAEIESSRLGAQTFRMADRLNSKAAALLTHVSIMIAVSSVLFSFSLNTPTLRDVPPIIGALLLCEIVTYSLTSLLCLYAVQMTGPSSFRAEDKRPLDRLLLIVRRRRKAYRVALAITIAATLVLIGLMGYIGAARPAAYAFVASAPAIADFRGSAFRTLRHRRKVRHSGPS